MKTAREWSEKYCICTPALKANGLTDEKCPCGVVEQVVELVRAEMDDSDDEEPQPKKKKK